MVVVEISSIKKSELEGSNLVLYKVSNFYNKNIFLVADNWFTWAAHDSVVEISFARAKMQAGVNVFGYFLPSVIKVVPKQSIVKELHLSFPLKLDTIWNKEKQVVLKKGNYRLKLKVGYGLSEKIDEGNFLTPEDQVMNWQKIAESKEYPLAI